MINKSDLEYFNYLLMESSEGLYLDWRIIIGNDEKIWLGIYERAFESNLGNDK